MYNLTTRLSKQSLVRLFALSLITSCGTVGTNDVEKNEASEVSKTSGSEVISIPVSFTQKNVLTLAAATTFNISMDGCASGFTATASELSPSLEVYKFDQNCLAKLTSFEAGGIIYTNQNAGATDFTTWLQGDTATFASSGGETVAVVVNEQLDSPISGTKTISYSFSEAVAGNVSNIASSVLGDAHTMSIDGEQAPNFTVDTISFTGMGAGGEAQLDIIAECGVAQTAGPDVCDGLDLTNITFWLVEDTFGGAPTLADLQALTSGASVSSVLNQGTAATTNDRGGFATGDILGSAPMHTKPEMLFVVKGSASYTYYEIDLSTLSSAQ